MPDQTRVLVWDENVHERKNAIVRQICPGGMHHCIAEGLREEPAFAVETATLQKDEDGLTESRLAQTDVLLWWGHAAHGEVSDAVVERVLSRVWEGMGLIAVSSSRLPKCMTSLSPSRRRTRLCFSPGLKGRSLSQRLHLETRERKDFLFPARARDLSDLFSPNR